MPERQKCGVWYFFYKIVRLPWHDIEKIGPDRSSAHKTLSFGEKKLRKLVQPLDPEIIRLREIIKKEEDKNERN